MTRFVGTPLRGIEFANAGDEAISVRVLGDSQARVRIDAGGRITWSSGSVAGDTVLFRDAANLLKTDDTFQAAGGLITITTDGAPTVELADGALAIDTTNNVFYFRSDGTWNQVTGGGGGASVTVSENAPESASEGDLWYESDTGSMFVYFDSTWIEVGSGGSTDFIAETIDAKGDLIVGTASATYTRLAAGSNGYFLKANSAAGTGLEWAAVPAATGNLTGIDSIGTPDYIQFDTTVGSPTASAGALQWDSDFGTLSFGLTGADTVVQVGFNNIAYCYNQDSVTITKGTPVYISGGQGSQVGIQRAYNTSDEGSARTLGLAAESISAGASGYVITYGVLAGVDTSTYTVGDILYLGSTAGTLTKVKPHAPNHYVFVGVVVKADVGGEIWLRPQNGYELDEIHDVDLITTPPVSGDFLKYNGTLWVNDAINLGTDTVGNYMVDVIAGTGVTVTHTPGEGSSASVQIGQDVATSASVQFAQVTTTGNVVVGGDLTVNGTTTTVNTETVLIADNIITLNSNETGSPSENAGIEVERGTSTNVQIRWNETSDKWQFTNDGSNYVDLGAGGATVTASAPATGDAGSLWFDSINGDLYVRYDSSWVQLTGQEPVVEDLNDLSDVAVLSPTPGDILKYDGTNWVSASAGPAIVVSSAAPASPVEGALWFDSDTAQTFIYYDFSWVDISGGSNAAQVTVSASAPGSPAEGEMWFDSDDARTYTYYDGTWVELGASGFTALVSDSAPVAPVSGQIWYKSDTGGTYVYYDSAWVEVGASSLNTILATVQAKGDLIVGTASETIDNLTVGTNGQILVADSSTATGLQWQTPTYASTGKAIAMAIVFGG